MAAIKLPISLTPKQKEVHASKARFRIIKAGRRWGKTRYAAFWIVMRALTIPGKHWFVCQSFDLIRDEVWPLLLELVPEQFIERKNEQFFTMRIRVGNLRSGISCKSGERDKNLRGRGLRSIVVEEAAFLKSHLYDVVLRPMLADYEAPALIISSAKKSWFSKMWAAAKSGADPEMEAFHFTIYDNPHIPPQEIEKIRMTTTESTWKEEYLAQECEYVGTVYHEWTESSVYDPQRNHLDVKQLVTIIPIDYGTSDDTAALWMGIGRSGECIFSQEHIKKNWDVERHATSIKVGSRGYPNELTYVLDRSAFRREGTSMTSIADQFHKAGIRCVRSEKDLNSSIDLVKRFLRGDSNGPWVKVSVTCKNLIRGFLEWDWKSHEPDPLAALRYGVAHAVKNRLTRLADLIPDSFSDADGAQDMEPAGARLPVRRGGADRWSWDSEAGAPG